MQIILVLYYSFSLSGGWSTLVYFILKNGNIIVMGNFIYEKGKFNITKYKRPHYGKIL